MAWDDELEIGSVAYQIAAAVHNRIRVLARPGTGKSFAMKRRVARLLEEGVAPQDILAVTFTRVAAEDLHRELLQLDVPGSQELRGQTLHGLAMRILSRAHVLEALGRTPRPLNDFELRALLCDLAPMHGGKRRCAKMIRAYTSAWAQSQGDAPGFAQTDAERLFETALLEWLRFHRGMLIGELIPYLVKYLRENPHAPEHNEYDHLYSFKNAHPEGIREWPAANPGCADHAMTECRRCPTRVVEIANALIAHNVNREPRNLVPRAINGPGEIQRLQFADLEAEAGWICGKVTRLLADGVHPSEMIILVQRSAAGRPIYNALREAGVPVKSYYEESQLDTALAQERFALFKLFLDGSDKVALRYLLGVGHVDFRASQYARLRAHCESADASPWEALEQLAAGEIDLPHTMGLIARFEQIRAQLELLTAHGAELIDLINALFPEAAAELIELRQLALGAVDVANTPQALMSAMLDEINQPDVPPVVEDVRLMSLHKCKGLSASYVFIASCVQGILPPRNDPDLTPAQNRAVLEEARRLFFVGLTRVKSDPNNNRPGSLFITYPHTMPLGLAFAANVDFARRKNGVAYLLASQFLDELGPAAPAPEAG
ncbi:MAG: ATP-dependent helicase [Proteobacteria bacterium]|nr:ATP-dependent helicase [Pseudomonadota bacterium]